MTLQHHCPSCRCLLTAPPGLSGRRVRCPRCAADLILPAREAEDEAAFYAERVVEQGPAAAQMGTAENPWDLSFLAGLHGAAEITESYEPPHAPDQPSGSTAPAPGSPVPAMPAPGGPWWQRMLQAMLDPQSIQWLLALGGGLMVLGGLIWLIGLGVLQSPLVVAVLLAAGSLCVLLAGWFITLRTGFHMAGRALTFLGCVFVSLNLWFLHAQDLLPMERGLWMAAAVCVVLYVITVRVLRDPLFVYAVEAGVTLTAVLLLGSYGLATSATSLSLLLMVLALLSIHGRLAFPDGKAEFNRETFGMPLFWSGHVQLAAASSVLLGAQLAGWMQTVAAFFALPEGGILLTNSQLVPALLWLAAAYAYGYSDLCVRRAGIYLYVAAAAVILAEVTLIGQTWGRESMIALLSLTAAGVSLFAARARHTDERLARIVAPLALLIGIGPLLIALGAYWTSASVVAIEWGVERLAGWPLVGAALLMAASHRLSAFAYRQKAPGLAAAYLGFTAASLGIAGAACLTATGIIDWRVQTPLLLLIPIGYMIAARLARGRLSSTERPLTVIAQVAVAYILVRGWTGAALAGQLDGLDGAGHTALAVALAEVALLFGLARWFYNRAAYSYLTIAALTVASWHAQMAVPLPDSLFTIAFATLGVVTLVVSRGLRREERSVYLAGGGKRTVVSGPGAEVARAGHTLLSLSLLALVLRTGLAMLSSGFQGRPFDGLEWLMLGVGLASAAAGSLMSPGSAWRRGYTLALIAISWIALVEFNLALPLSLWRKAEIVAVLCGLVLLGGGYVGRFREEEDGPRNEMVSFCLLVGSLLAVVPLLLAAFAQWNLTGAFSAADEIAFLAISLLVLATGITWRVKAATVLSATALAAYLCVLLVSVVYHPQVAVGIYLAVGGALLFGLGMLLAVYRDRLASLPKQVANREGVFRVIGWR